MGKSKKYVLVLQKSHDEDGSNAVLLVGHVRTDNVTPKDIIEDFVVIFHKYFEDKISEYIPRCCLKTKENHCVAKYFYNCGRRLVVCVDEIIAHEFMAIFDGTLDNLRH